jgi:iron complex transport system ATP-binding protein
MLEVKGLSYRSILDSLEFSVRRGELVAILGPNGAGKTTLFRCLARLIRPSQGEILLKGRPLSSYPVKELYRVLSLAPQFSRIGFSYRVLTVVLMGRASFLSPFTPPGRQDYEKVREALALLGIADLAERPFHTLSGGQQRLVLIARALAQEAECLLLDEPTAHLDLKHQILVLSKVRALARQKGLTILINLHDPNLALTHADRVLCLKKGKLIGELTAESQEKVQQALENLYEIPFFVFKRGDHLFVFPQEKRV